MFGIPLGPNSSVWFGADSCGRDVFVRTIYGARVSLLVGVVATGIAVVIGVVLGVLGGYFGGWVDSIISRVTDIILAAAAAAVRDRHRGRLLHVEGGLPRRDPEARADARHRDHLAVHVALRRAARARNTLSLREREFVESSRSLGASNTRIMFRQILPNLVSPIIVYASLLVPANILFEAYLSFLGLGVPDDMPSWGNMLSATRSTSSVSLGGSGCSPVSSSCCTVLAFNLLGDGLRDALDPRNR